MHDDSDDDSAFDEGDVRMQKEFNDRMMRMNESNGKACHALRYVEHFAGETMTEKEQKVYDAALDALFNYFS